MGVGRAMPRFFKFYKVGVAVSFTMNKCIVNNGGGDLSLQARSHRA